MATVRTGKAICSYSSCCFLPMLPEEEDRGVKCENCGAPMEMNADRGCFVCPYCETEWAPETNIDGVRVLGPADVDCPLCKSKLSKGKLLDYGLLYCQTCKGMLVQMDDLVSLTSDLRASRDAPAYSGKPPDPRDLERHIDCPQCHQEMDTHEYGGPGNVIVDSCESCSVLWLDRGELRRIAMAPDHYFTA